MHICVLAPFGLDLDREGARDIPPLCLVRASGNMRQSDDSIPESRQLNREWPMTNGPGSAALSLMRSSLAIQIILHKLVKLISRILLPFRPSHTIKFN